MENSNMFLIVGGVAAVVVIYLIFMVFSMKKTKARKEKFIAENPDYSKVIFDTKTNMMIQGQFMFHSFDGGAPGEILFFEKGNYAAYFAQPGKHELEISYSYTRPGVMYKNVTKTYGPVKFNVEIEPKKTYVLTFNRKLKDFEITEKE